MITFFPGLKDGGLMLQSPQDGDDENRLEFNGEDADWVEEEQAESSESMPLFLPSSIPVSELDRLGLTSLAKQELQLRKGQANDILEALRLALVHKSLLFRTQVSGLKSGKPI